MQTLSVARRALLVVVVAAHPGVAVAEPPAAPDPAPRLGKAGLTVRLSLADLDGRPLAQVAAGETFGLELRFEDPAGGALPRDLAPTAWLRRLVPGRATCQQAAQMVRVTRRLSPDDVPLAGLSILTLDAAHRLAVIDPHQPANARIVAPIVPAGEPPGAVVVHPDLGAALMSRPERGDILLAPLPSGRAVVLAHGLGRPTALLPAPGRRLWVGDEAEGRALLINAATGAVERAVALARPGPVWLMAAGPDAVAIVDGDGTALFADAATGLPTARFPAGAASGAAAAIPDGLVAVGEDGRLLMRYADDPEREHDLGIAGRALGVSADPSGRWAVAWARRSGDGAGGEVEVSVLDLARGLRVAGFVAPEPVDEAVVTPRAAFLSWPSRPVVTVLDLAAPPGADRPVDRDVRLAEEPAAAARDGLAARRGHPMMVPLTPLAAVAVVRPGGRTLHTITAGGGLTSAPMSVLALKGDPPVALAAYPRSLVPGPPGKFRATARLPRGGSWELAVTKGVGGTTACLPLPAETEPEPPEQPHLVGDVQRRADGPGRELVLGLAGWSEARAKPGALALRVGALDGSSMRSVLARRDADGLFRADLPWADDRDYAVALEDEDLARPTVVHGRAAPAPDAAIGARP